ncbi:methyl-accepting chemotaxis protein [Geobacter argillaceus]|uniref:Methyl-accepting chemotaxis sensory transducer n=1 Tax=Geobacter argillaceus TaxID=345631 RepID=A0A562WSI5_9BACT|nr:HAMP domain-containing methyl-accepting chemotaxis protein [Geobacter argillaceus]TWJ33085.1 methyl-accepting chemotaxis sensory transducer [Geobacter argillaceus]
MARNLRFGSRLIHLLLLVGFAVSGIGLLAASNILIVIPPEQFAFFCRSAFGACAILFALVVLMLIARGLAKRIKTLASALRRGAEGDLTIRVPVTTGDELGQLAQNFNGMLARLGELVTNTKKAIIELIRISAENRAVAATVINAAETQSNEVATASDAVKRINGSVAKVSDGVQNLTASARKNTGAIDEMAASINEVRHNVEIQAASIEEVSSAMGQMAAVVEEIGGNVESLMQAADKTTSSVAEMDETIKQVEQNARETAAISDNVRHDAELGKQSVDATIAGIDEIRRSSKATLASIASLTERAEAIGSILSVIDEVAEQTNLLALNSAIIAAQAGEHGKGFAIVSSEIKALANRTRQSTMEIGELIKGVQEETGKAMTAISQTEQKVAEGELLSQRSGDALAKVVSGVVMASRQVGEIADATVEQARGSQEIHGAMQHVAEMVAQIARSCQEQVATSKGVMRAVDLMKDFTGQVLASTDRQHTVGGVIATSTGQMTDIIQGIRDACQEQTACSEQIDHAMASVQNSANSNLDSARILEHGVESLSFQIDVLRREMAKLQVE